MKKITAIKVLENYRVSLRFNDGAEGEIDFSSKPRTGVFAFWNNYENFRKARILPQLPFHDGGRSEVVGSLS